MLLITKRICAWALNQTLGYTDRIGSKPMNFMLEILSRIGLEIEREWL